MKKQLILLLFTATITLTACGNNSSANDMSTSNSQTEHSSHSSSGELPNDLKVAESPTYTIGSEAIIHTDHMEGMNSAVATIVGAFDTTAYTVSYRPTTGGVPVTNHKWIIHEEIKKHSEEPYEAGADVTMEADHLQGMNGAKAQINAAEHTTVYMIDYTPTTGGDKVKNHKWVTESELSAVKK